MSGAYRPDVNDEEMVVAGEAINKALGNVLHPQSARNAAYAALIALRRRAVQKADDARSTQIEAAARMLCVLDGREPDRMIPYEEVGNHRCKRVQPKRAAPVWPEAPQWSWYADRAERILAAALVD